MTALKARKLSLKYGNHYVFKNLSFQINENDFVCIVGPNGSGKSTLLKCIIGELKPTAGKIEYGPSLERDTIGYLPQHANYNPQFPASVSEIVSSGALNQIKPFSPLPKESIYNALETLGIKEISRNHFGALSGGQRQRVLLARALVAGRNLLILDEPSNNLDYTTKQELYSTLKKLNQSTTIIMVTHDLDHHNLIGNKILSLDPNFSFYGNTNEYVRKIHDI